MSFDITSVLKGVSGLMASYTHRRERITVVNVRRQPQHLGGGIVMVGQKAADALNPNVHHPVTLQHSLGRRRAGQTG